ncbi:phosphotransferase family protein, partial [Nocardia aurea]|uniref:phosphotransferase family protein n=1 Tax=Nocardia aurea TaxID=2144174 RepID=UPI001300589B
MAAHGIDPAGELSFERVGLGQSNLTYRLREGGGRSWVLRRPPLGELLESAHDVVREARILAALRETGVPVPEVHGVLPPGAVGDDAPAFLMSWVDGTVLDRMAVAEAIPPVLRRAVGLSLARTLAEVHAVDLDATGLSGLASHAPYAPRQLKRWSRQWEHSKTRELPALDALTRRLAGAAGPQRETTLVHGDPHPQNVI